MSKFLTTKEVCTEYGFKQKTLYKWAAESKVPHFRVNGVIMFSPIALDNWMNKKEVKAKAITA